MTRNSLLAIGAIALLALALGIAWLARPERAPPGQLDAVLAAIDRVAAEQQRQDARLARLEAQRTAGGPLPAAGSPVPRAPGDSGNNSSPRNAVDDPAQAEARFQAQLRALEDKLVSEPLSAAWATRQEKVVTQFLAPASLAKEGLPAPKSSDTRCQSTICRIRMTFADPQDAERTEGALLMGMADGLPHAQTFTLPRPDGSVDLVVFASGDPKALR